MPRGRTGLLGPLVDAQGHPVVISRRDAADSGRTFFYTGKPCEHGHMSLRYTTNGGCKECTATKFKPRVNPWSTKLVPFTSSKLWTLGDFTREERITLRVYLQHCIFEFVRKNRAGQSATYLAEVQAAMDEIENRGRFALNDPRNME